MGDVIDGGQYATERRPAQRPRLTRSGRSLRVGPLRSRTILPSVSCAGRGAPPNSRRVSAPAAGASRKQPRDSGWRASASSPSRCSDCGRTCWTSPASRRGCRPWSRTASACSRCSPTWWGTRSSSPRPADASGCPRGGTRRGCASPWRTRGRGSRGAPAARLRPLLEDAGRKPPRRGAGAGDLQGNRRSARREHRRPVGARPGEHLRLHPPRRGDRAGGVARNRERSARPTCGRGAPCVAAPDPVSRPPAFSPRKPGSGRGEAGRERRWGTWSSSWRQVDGPRAAACVKF